MNEIVVLWSHPDDPTIPPLVCPDTCRTVKEVVEEFQKGKNGHELSLRFREETSPDKERGSFRLTIDGAPLEELVPLPDPSKYCGVACKGCGTGERRETTSCSRVYEQIPESVLRLALAKATEQKLNR